MKDFNPDRYTECIGGYAMPELEQGSISVELLDWDENNILYSVPSDAVQRMNMPRLAHSTSAEVREPFERGIGLALVACRILNKHEDLFLLEIPTDPPSTIVVKWDQLARRR